jgi:hypothetical protein
VKHRPDLSIDAETKIRVWLVRPLNGKRPFWHFEICRSIRLKNTIQEPGKFEQGKMKFVSVPRELSKFEGFYCSPNTIKHRSIIENVQRRTTYSAHRLPDAEIRESKFILNYPERLAKTTLLPLEFRREISDLQLLYKSRMGLLSMDVNKYLCTYESGYKSRRNYDESSLTSIFSWSVNEITLKIRSLLGRRICGIVF